jgi:DNA-binding XRE family transcriptional regulator
MWQADHMACLDQPARQGGHAPRGQPEPVAELARREAAEHDEVLERGELDLMEAELPGPRGPLVLAGELDSVEEQSQGRARVGRRGRLGRLRLGHWLCTHWPTSSRMPAVSPEEQFAQNLRKQRHAAGLSQEQLAHLTGLHPTEISRLERAAREPRLGTMVRLARGLDVGVDSLVADIR